MKKKGKNISTFQKTDVAKIQSLLEKGTVDKVEMSTMMEKLLHWAAIVESSDDAIISKSIDGYITSWNKGAERLYGYTAEEAIGQPISILIPPEKKDDFPYIMKLLRQGKLVERYHTQRMTKDGRILDVSLTVSAIRDFHGNIIGVSKIARDITERVQAEKRRDEFVSTTSHELKTPITSLKAFAELLEQRINEKGYDELKLYIRKINQQTDKLTKLIEDLVELSRMQTGSLRIENKPFEFDPLVEEIVENIKMTMRHQVIQKGKTKKIIKGDRDRTGQAITNLLTNAIKYSPKADKVIVTLKVRDESVMLSVQDFGIGVPKEFHEKVFELFFRITGPDEKTYPGMGIGLYLCKEIISRQGGKIWITSEKGKGSTFYLTLPFIK